MSSTEIWTKINTWMFSYHSSDRSYGSETAQMHQSTMSPLKSRREMWENLSVSIFILPVLQNEFQQIVFEDIYTFNTC